MILGEEQVMAPTYVCTIIPQNLGICYLTHQKGLANGMSTEMVGLSRWAQTKNVSPGKKRTSSGWRQRTCGRMGGQSMRRT